MSLSVCPIAVVNAPSKVVWDLLSNPLTDTDWSDAIVDRVLPGGRAKTGQRVIGHARLGRLERPVLIEVRGVDSIAHTLDLTTSLPLGITVRNHITMTPLTPSLARLPLAEALATHLHGGDGSWKPWLQDRWGTTFRIRLGD